MKAGKMPSLTFSNNSAVKKFMPERINRDRQMRSSTVAIRSRIAVL